jgi:hypothetical protein
MAATRPDEAMDDGVTCGLIIAPAPLCSCLPSVKPVKSLASVFRVNTRGAKHVSRLGK